MRKTLISTILGFFLLFPAIFSIAGDPGSAVLTLLRAEIPAEFSTSSVVTLRVSGDLAKATDIRAVIGWIHVDSDSPMEHHKARAPSKLPNYITYEAKPGSDPNLLQVNVTFKTTGSKRGICHLKYNMDGNKMVTNDVNINTFHVK